ncbi:lytic murein transglycosylase B [gamma proteobacterium HTCC5015]|nr:lytic murein transglycosylase B [gamma proteobacterium HTCC5015]
MSEMLGDSVNKHFWNRTLKLGWVLWAVSSVAWADDVSDMRYSERPEVVAFAEDLIRQHDFGRGELLGLFKAAERQQAVIDAYKKPAERALRWDEYRPIFIQESRIAAGAEFMREHAEILARAEAEYGVPPEMVAAIIGVETRFGRYKGKHPVFDSLVTLAFDGQERRRAFFRKELKAFLLLCREQGFVPREVVGSYAGAMGMPQFIASSYRAYAVDFDQDGRIDLFDNVEDVIGSVANYFQRHGWRAEGQVVTPATLAQNSQAKAVGRGRTGMKPETPYQDYRGQGVKAAESLADTEEVVLLHYLDGEEDLYYLGHHNFYVISRYNHSSMYSLAAWQLAGMIAERYSQRQES